MNNHLPPSQSTKGFCQCGDHGDNKSWRNFCGVCCKPKHFWKCTRCDKENNVDENCCGYCGAVWGVPNPAAIEPAPNRHGVFVNNGGTLTMETMVLEDRTNQQRDRPYDFHQGYPPQPNPHYSEYFHHYQAPRPFQPPIQPPFQPPFDSMGRTSSSPYPHPRPPPVPPPYHQPTDGLGYSYPGYNFHLETNHSTVAHQHPSDVRMMEARFVEGRVCPLLTTQEEKEDFLDNLPCLEFFQDRTQVKESWVWAVILSFTSNGELDDLSTLLGLKRGFKCVCQEIQCKQVSLFVDIVQNSTFSERPGRKGSGFHRISRNMAVLSHGLGKDITSVGTRVRVDNTHFHPIVQKYHVRNPGHAIITPKTAQQLQSMDPNLNLPGIVQHNGGQKYFIVPGHQNGLVEHLDQGKLLADWSGLGLELQLVPETVCTPVVAQAALTTEVEAPTAPGAALPQAAILVDPPTATVAVPPIESLEVIATVPRTTAPTFTLASPTAPPTEPQGETATVPRTTTPSAFTASPTAPQTGEAPTAPPASPTVTGIATTTAPRPATPIAPHASPTTSPTAPSTATPTVTLLQQNDGPSESPTPEEPTPPGKLPTVLMPEPVPMPELSPAEKAKQEEEISSEHALIWLEGAQTNFDKLDRTRFIDTYQNASKTVYQYDEHLKNNKLPVTHFTSHQLVDSTTVVKALEMHDLIVGTRQQTDKYQKDNHCREINWKGDRLNHIRLDKDEIRVLGNGETGKYLGSCSAFPAFLQTIRSDSIKQVKQHDVDDLYQDESLYYGTKRSKVGRMLANLGYKKHDSAFAAAEAHFQAKHNTTITTFAPHVDKIGRLVIFEPLQGESWVFVAVPEWEDVGFDYQLFGGPAYRKWTQTLNEDDLKVAKDYEKEFMTEARKMYSSNRVFVFHLKPGCRLVFDAKYYVHGSIIPAQPVGRHLLIFHSLELAYWGQFRDLRDLPKVGKMSVEAMRAELAIDSGGGSKKTLAKKVEAHRKDPAAAILKALQSILWKPQESQPTP